MPRKNCIPAKTIARISDATQKRLNRLRNAAQDLLDNAEDLRGYIVAESLYVGEEWNASPVNQDTMDRLLEIKEIARNVEKLAEVVLAITGVARQGKSMT